MVSKDDQIDVSPTVEGLVFYRKMLQNGNCVKLTIASVKDQRILVK